jgi:hypothetical protein
VDTMQESLQNSAAQVRNLVLWEPIRTSNLAVSWSSAVEVIKDCVNTAGANGVWRGTRLALAAIVLHFLELELLCSGRNADLMED